MMGYGRAEIEGLAIDLAKTLVEAAGPSGREAPVGVDEIRGVCGEWLWDHFGAEDELIISPN